MDRTTKILLAAIALGLWANAGVSVLRPAVAQVHNVADDVHTIMAALGDIYTGRCTNKKIC
jgi:hypothetical protein